MDTVSTLAALDRVDRMVPEAPPASFLRGEVLTATGDSTGAVTAYRIAWRGDPDRGVYREAFLRSLLALGKRLYEEEAYAEAWDLVAEASSLETSSDLAYLTGLVAYARARSVLPEAQEEYLLRAEEAFRRVLAADPGDEDAEFNLGAVVLAQDRFEEAAGIYRNLLRRNPKSGALFLALSHVHGLSGDNEAALAEEALGKALRSGEPVANPGAWAARAADRFPESDLATAYTAWAGPEEVYTYTIPGGGLVEAWFYWTRGWAAAFREGGRIGSVVPLGL